MADDQNSVSSSTSRLSPSSGETASELEASSLGTRTTFSLLAAPATDDSTEEAADIDGAGARTVTGCLPQSSGYGSDLNRVAPTSLMLDTDQQEKQQVAASGTTTAAAARTTTAPSRATTTVQQQLTNPAIITTRPLILITDSNSPTNSQGSPSCLQGVTSKSRQENTTSASYSTAAASLEHKEHEEREENLVLSRHQKDAGDQEEEEEEEEEDEEQVEEVDGIRYRIVSAVTTKQRKKPLGGKKSRPKHDEGVNSKTAADGVRAYQVASKPGESGAAAASTKPLNFGSGGGSSSNNNNNNNDQQYRTNQGRPKVIIMGASGKVDKENLDNDNYSSDQHDDFKRSTAKDWQQQGKNYKQKSTTIYTTTKQQQHQADADYGENDEPAARGVGREYLHGQDRGEGEDEDGESWRKLNKHQSARRLSTKSSSGRLSFVRRKSSAFVANLLQLSNSTSDNNELGPNMTHQPRLRRLSIYEMTKSPPPETSLEIYLSERRRSSTVSSKQVQQQLAEQQSTFETNYCQRQQYFKDLNQKLINQDKKLLNVVANRGQIHRHSVDIAQLPLVSAAAKGSKSRSAALKAQEVVLESNQEVEQQHQGGEEEDEQISFLEEGQDKQVDLELQPTSNIISSSLNDSDKSNQLVSHRQAINQSSSHLPSSLLKQTTDNNKYLTEQLVDNASPIDGHREGQQQQLQVYKGKQQQSKHQLAAIKEDGRRYLMEQRGSIVSSRGERIQKSRIVIRKFQKLDSSELSSTPAPDVKIGQRIAFKEYYGNEFGTIRWIGRVPQICPDWTVGVEFDNAIGEGDGSLNGRRYFIAKDCFAKFLPLNAVALVDQHVGRPEPGTMISVMSAAVRPGQMISIQRVSTVHVQHCFLNAPHQRPTGADILAVNTRLHCQCPNCGPCAHVIKPPRTQRLAHAGKNATHMCQFSTYTCCGMESQEEATCTYTGNKIASFIPPNYSSPSVPPPPPIGNSWIEGSGYLTNLQAQQSKSMPDEYKLGFAPEDVVNPESLRRLSRSSSRRGSGRRRRHKRMQDSSNVVKSNLRQPADIQIDNNNNNNKTINATTGQHTTTTATTIDKSTTNLYQYQSTTQDLNSTYSPTPSPIDPNQYALACPDKTTVHADDVNWCQENNPKGAPRSPKVVYRNSIENRYLFPTDDPIDSTLEADLENLSQARYGHSHPSRLSGSRNIFKSLLSLVSCLSAHSNHSDFDRHSENTLHFSEQAIKNNINKAMPKIETINEQHNYLNHQLNDISEKDSYHLESGPSAVHQSCEHKQAGIACSDQRIRRHISSSSDCGFSSASQNSANFQSFPACSPIMTADDELRTKQIYKRIVTRLMNSTSISNEDLHRLKSILFEPHFENCCLNTHNVNQSTFNSFGTMETDQIIADIIQRSYLKQDKCCEQQTARQGSDFHHTTNYCLSPSRIGLDQTGDHFRSSSIDRYKKMIGSERLKDESEGLNMELLNGGLAQNYDNICEASKLSLNRSLVEGSLTSESATLSSYDSYCGTAIVGDNNSTASNTDLKKRDAARLLGVNSAPESSNLPKAFELKLTLSINSDNKTQITSIKDSSGEAVDYSSVKDESCGSNKGIVNSTFNINIVSSHQDEDDLKNSVPDSKVTNVPENESTKNDQS